MTDYINYMPTFEQKLGTKGYPMVGFYYQYGRDSIDQTTESDAEKQKQTASVIRSAYSTFTPTGVCLTMDSMEPNMEGKYKCIHIWYKDFMKPHSDNTLLAYSLAAVMTIPQNFKDDVNNMVFLDFAHDCDLVLENPPDIAHVLGSSMDKQKYAEADESGCFIELPSVRTVLREKMVAKKRRDVFQISTSGLIKI